MPQDVGRPQLAGRQSPVEPRPSPGPVALDGGGRCLERVGRLVDAEPREEAQLDDAAVTGVEEDGAPGLVEREHVHARLSESAGDTLSRLTIVDCRRACRRVAGGVIGEDLAHQHGRPPQKKWARSFSVIRSTSTSRR